ATECAAVLRRHSSARWREKVHFAGLRRQRLGWEEACHHAALEVLGYRFNRAPMLRIAGEWPLTRWANGNVDTERVCAGEAEGWSLQGVRPANHPRTRLRQYAAWCRERPGWPAGVRELAAGWPVLEREEGTRTARR